MARAAILCRMNQRGTIADDRCRDPLLPLNDRRGAQKTLEALLAKTAFSLADGKPDEALASATLATTRHSDSASAFFTLGRVQAARKQPEAAIAADGVRYHGFNLLVGDVANGAYASNRASGALALGRGIHGLSNHLLDTPWPKLTRSKARFAACLATSDDGVEPLAGAVGWPTMFGK